MNIYEFLDHHQLGYQRFDHPPVFTVDQANDLGTHIPGGRTKNLFLRNDKGARHLLVTVPDTKQVDLRALGQMLNIKGLGFASPERLKRFLQVEPGSVTMLALMHDHEHAVECYIDQALWEEAELQCHPLVNTQTLVISKNDLERFFVITGHSVSVISVPAKA